MISTISNFKSKTVFLGILSFVVLTILTVGCSKQIEQREFTLVVDKQKSLVSLHASHVPLSNILQRFEQNHQIKIVVPDFQDRRVSLIASDQPLNSVIRRLLPEEKRYWIVMAKDLFDLKGSQGKKTGKKYSRREGLPEKGATKGPMISPDAKLKVTPDKVALFVSQGGSETKNIPDPSRMIVGTGTQDSGKPSVVVPAGRYLRLRFRLKDGKFTLEKTIILRGTYIPPESIHGKYIFSVYSGSQVLAVGSFRDPLEIHSHFPEPKQPHKTLRLDAAAVDLDLPEIVLKDEYIKKFHIGIYTFSGAPPSQKLTPKTFRKFEKILQKMDEVSNKNIYEKLKMHLERKSGEDQ